MDITIFDLLERWQPFEEKEPEKGFEYCFMLPNQLNVNFQYYKVLKEWCKDVSIELVRKKLNGWMFSDIMIYEGVRVSFTLK
jgi:hypothetical protein